MLQPPEPDIVPSSANVAVIVVPGRTFEVPIPPSAEMRVHVPDSGEEGSVAVTSGVMGDGVAGVVAGGIVPRGAVQPARSTATIIPPMRNRIAFWFIKTSARLNAINRSLSDTLVLFPIVVAEWYPIGLPSHFIDCNQIQIIRS